MNEEKKDLANEKIIFDTELINKLKSKKDKNNSVGTMTVG